MGNYIKITTPWGEIPIDKKVELEWAMNVVCKENNISLKELKELLKK